MNSGAVKGIYMETELNDHHEAPGEGGPKQRLLYLQARTPSVFSEIIGLTQIEPTKGFRASIDANEPNWPYTTVHDAVVDGWQIVQFPHLQAPFEDQDIDVIGYEFILQKMEVIDG